ncbi:MAG: hypothetical protein P1U68_12720 [Verrucomicrobiales bacterium]|nr:hypothetical protein [Verrucomicrobiales bacterium]
MPILIGALFIAMVTFFIRTKPAEEPPHQEVVSHTEEPPSLSGDSAAKPEIVEPAPEKDAGDAIIPAKTESDSTKPQDSNRGINTVSAPIEATGSFTAWMTPLALDTYIRQKNRGYSESFWQRGHWITAIEGRWANGSREFRISLDKIPDLNRWQWQYRVNQSADEFVNTSREFADQGFELVQTQTFSEPDGDTKFQAVWQRKVPESAPVVETMATTSSSSDSAQTLDVNNLRFR